MADTSTDTPAYSLNGGDIAWVLTSTALVFLMCAGLGFFYSGLARAKHALSLMFLMMLSISIVSVQWYFWGYSLAFSETGTSGFVGDLRHIVMRDVGMEPHPNAKTIPGIVFFLFQCMFAAITPALAFGSTAERMKIMPAIIFLFIWSTLVYDIVTNWVWGPHGWLLKLGVMDYAGGTPVHIASGVAAVAYAMVLGKRSDYNDTDSAAHNVSFVYLGTALLWFGWMGFNGGSALAANTRGIQAIVNSHLSACVGGIIWVALDYRHARKLSMIGFCTGAVAGLATVTPACGFVSSSSSLVFGFLGAIVCNVAITYKQKFGFDDALDVFAVHYIGGLLGLVLTGVFAQQSIMALSAAPGDVVPLGGWLDGNWIQVPIQLAAIAAVSVWSFVVTYAILIFMSKIGLRLRMDEDEVAIGTDLAQLGETAYGFLQPNDIASPTASLMTSPSSSASNREGLRASVISESSLSRAPDTIVGSAS
ncbi:ammonium transporter AmtB-like domain-containing protein [Syncephalis pseudoplumigaleata]|uniref:Ammonium transporter n=1 Tax=Syncephalis pseudoplumigaleata TaxID=1712513 RepID=A0A4P9YUL6_9FUNG|nr:ammonium transporter AmtB-like domain-containing protein [Syncephalis pseudoplumigaleata]|eukprot:RKP23534.1 ammonium transporter AmtB-like domain-containing protein [Syncephalis pseudoplumigaleata]